MEVAVVVLVVVVVVVVVVSVVTVQLPAYFHPYQLLSPTHDSKSKAIYIFITSVGNYVSHNRRSETQKKLTRHHTGGAQGYQHSSAFFKL